MEIVPISSYSGRKKNYSILHNTPIYRGPQNTRDNEHANGSFRAIDPNNSSRSIKDSQWCFSRFNEHSPVRRQCVCCARCRELLPVAEHAPPEQLYIRWTGGGGGGCSEKWWRGLDVRLFIIEQV